MPPFALADKRPWRGGASARHDEARIGVICEICGSPSSGMKPIMVWLLYIGGGLFVLVVLFTLFGLWHMRQSERQALDEIQRIELAEIEALAAECVEVF